MAPSLRSSESKWHDTSESKWRHVPRDCPYNSLKSRETESAADMAQAMTGLRQRVNFGVSVPAPFGQAPRASDATNPGSGCGIHDCLERC